MSCFSLDRRAFLQRGACAGLGAALAGGAQAQTFPSRMVRIITPFPAGSGPDAALRMVAEQLSQHWKQAVVVDNRPGGNGFIAWAAFQQGAKDGHDLIQFDSTHITAHPSTYAKLPYEVQRDLAPLAMLLRTPFFVAVGARSPWRSLDELVLAARDKPGRISYGSWFNGSPGHLAGLLLQAQQHVHMLHVPFRDFGQLYTAVSNQEVDWAMASVATAAPLEQAGRLRFVTLAAAQRDPLYPKVPTTAESPLTKGFEVSAWAGLFAPAGLPAAQQNAIGADIRQALAAPGVVQSYRTMGYEAPPLAPAAFGALIRKETARWADIIRTAGLKLD